MTGMCHEGKLRVDVHVCEVKVKKKKNQIKFTIL